MTLSDAIMQVALDERRAVIVAAKASKPELTVAEASRLARRVLDRQAELMRHYAAKR